ncbi:molybdopterin molybdotransferase MoeA [Candidimonas humi]|uniref:Molybdopterin molybdenumtransferase n=1 Tax=Candidimonas humi TaxID=683355 RepID=A0ABV8NY19_9BURK|nr:gephyrin-like molybdotransferase Glp [Candidimonas humi]MBV6304675.1 molybdopterin molybdotransferase MoeA [Candidimonas humi]
MLDFDTAQARLAQAGKAPTHTEKCPLHLAAGRVLAHAVTARLDLPPADNSAMDGYAIRYADYQPGRRLPIQERCYAGQRPQPLREGQATRLFTGSVMPEGADTVVMQEDCTEADDMLEIREAPKAGSHVRKRGEDMQQGGTVLEAGTVLGAAQIAALAAQGVGQLEVFPRLRVGILTTGDELVFPGRELAPAQIYNSNGPMLASLVDGLGAQVLHVLHAVDTDVSVRKAFKMLIKDCDLVLTVGGVSVGEKDLVKPAIEQAGATLDLWRVCMKPGKPVALAHARNKPIVCLPGNPVSAYTVFTLLVTPLIRAMQGRAAILPPVRQARLRSDRVFRESREEFLRVRAQESETGVAEVTPYGNQGSGVVSSLPWATGFARVPVNTDVRDGDLLRYYDCRHWLA